MRARDGRRNEAPPVRRGAPLSERLAGQARLAAMKPRLFDGEHLQAHEPSDRVHVAAMKPRLFDGEHPGDPVKSTRPHFAAMKPRLFDGEHG